MRILLDTNIIIHRESFRASHLAIGQLFRWLDRLHYTKCIHPLTVAEIKKFGDEAVVRSMGIKMESYHVLKTLAPVHPSIAQVMAAQDKDDNSRNDSILLNEVLQDRVDRFITEDRGVHRKAAGLGIGDRVLTISHFVEREAAAHPEFINYKVLSVQKTYFGSVNLQDSFFDSFRQDYQGFDRWFASKSDDFSYVCTSGKHLLGFLYIKIEGAGAESYSDIRPPFTPKKRLKIGTLKVAVNGLRIGERFLKIIFDHALLYKVAEIYVTVFEHTPEQLRLIELLEEWGFRLHGEKATPTGNEKVFTRDFSRRANRERPRLTFPYFSAAAQPFLVPIYPNYHTELLPDSILSTESPANFQEAEPHRNALGKVYISHSYERGLQPGDVILFYRTGGKYHSVVSTIGIVENVHHPATLEELAALCRKKTFFKMEDLKAFWTRYPGNRPFVVEFLYAYSLPKRLTLARLIEMEVIPDIFSAPRGFSKISLDKLRAILRDSHSDESIIVN